MNINIYMRAFVVDNNDYGRIINMPLGYDNGDKFQIYVTQCKGAGDKWRVSDDGATLMELSIENHIDYGKDKRFQDILAANDVRYENGSLSLYCTEKGITSMILLLCQVITKICCIEPTTRKDKA